MIKFKLIIVDSNGTHLDFGTSCVAMCCNSDKNNKTALSIPSCLCLTISAKPIFRNTRKGVFQPALSVADTHFNKESLYK